MGKFKIKSSVKKRFRITATGKIKIKKAGRSHLLSGKDRRRKLKLKKAGILSKCYSKKIKKLLGA
jgi:large subunit ribosomal protein L35